MKITIVKNDVPVTIEIDAGETSNLQAILSILSSPNSHIHSPRIVKREASTLPKAKVVVRNTTHRPRWSREEIDIIVSAILDGKRPEDLEDEKTLRKSHSKKTIVWHVYQAVAPGSDLTVYQKDVAQYLEEEFSVSRMDLRTKYKELRDNARLAARAS